MNIFRFIAEDSRGAVIQESAVHAPTQGAACRSFWEGLTDEQRDACACVECIDEVKL